MQKSSLAALACALLLPLCARAQGTLTGSFVTALGGPVPNGTLQLTLSQAAIVSGSFAVSPQTVSCYTSTNGAVVGVPNPTATPTGSVNLLSGTLTAGTYYVEIALVNPANTATTIVSPEASFTLSSAGTLTINSPSISNSVAGFYDVYISTTSGGEQPFSGNQEPIGTNLAISAPPTLSGSVPSSNTTVCSLYFNSALIPSYTTYSAQLLDSASNQVPGYPQNWYLSGSTVDVSTITPLASNPAVRFPMPILAQSFPAQSIAGALNVGGNVDAGSLTVHTHTVTSFVGGFWSGTLSGAPNTVLIEWTPTGPLNALRLNGLAQTAGAGTGGDTFELVGATSGNTCTFAVTGGGYFAGTATYGSTTGTGTCNFNAGENVLLKFFSSSRSGGSEPGNIGFVIETSPH